MSKGLQVETTEETKACIEEAFLSLYSEMKFCDISVNLITERALCSRRTFYRYFSNTDALLEHLEDKHTPTLEAQYILENSSSIQMETASDIVTMFYDRHHKAVFTLITGSESARYIRKQRESMKQVMMSLTKRAYKVPSMQLDYLCDYLARAKVEQIEIWAEHNCEVSITQITRMIDSIVEDNFWTRIAEQHESFGGPKHRKDVSAKQYAFPWENQA